MKSINNLYIIDNYQDIVNEALNLITSEELNIKKDNVIQLSDYGNDEFYLLSDSVAESIKIKKNEYINEIFLYFVQPFLLKDKVLKDNNIKRIIIKSKKNIFENFFWILGAKKNFIKINIGYKSLLYRFINLFSILLSVLLLFSNFLIIVFKTGTIINKKISIKKNKKISVLRTPASEQKMNKIINKERIFSLIENYSNFSKSELYHIGNMFFKIKVLYFVLIRSLKDIMIIRKNVLAMLGKEAMLPVLFFYSFRIPYLKLYEIYLNELFCKNPGSIYYSGNNLDRYAFVEEKIAKSHNIKTICIPHGLEYGFKFPFCFTGDEFYCTSKDASIFLNKLYNEKKFKFNEKIAYDMFYKNGEIKKNKDIVFFTEPREIDVNKLIISKIISSLKTLNINKLRIKLHPKDDKKNYTAFSKSIIFVDNYTEAITSNICLARKSTILIEALYNNSGSIAILINNKDKSIFNTIASLQDKKIEKVYCIDDIIEKINDFKKK